MTKKGDVYRLSQYLVTASLELAVADRRLPGGEAVPMIDRRMASLVHAAREFMGAVDGLEPGELPRTWRPEPEEAAS